MKPSKFRAMPVDEFDFELMVESYDPEAKNGFIFGWVTMMSIYTRAARCLCTATMTELW